MIALPLAIFILVTSIIYGDQRNANLAAHEICPETHVARVDDHFEFGCDGKQYTVDCSDGDCQIESR